MSILLEDFNHRFPAFFVENIYSLAHELIYTYTSHFSQLLYDVSLPVRQYKMNVLFTDKGTLLCLRGLLFFCFLLAILDLLFNSINFSNMSNIGIIVLSYIRFFENCVIRSWRCKHLLSGRYGFIKGICPCSNGNLFLSHYLLLSFFSRTSILKISRIRSL